eukprot:278921_1
MSQQAFVELQRRRNNIISKLCIPEKFCFVIIGFVFGILFSHLIINHWTTHNMIQNPSPYIDLLPDISSLNLENISSNVHHFQNALINGLKSGMHLIAKHKPLKSTKNIRILYIVGNEGSGHHLWENIMREMSKHSQLINTNYVDNNIIMVEILHSCFMEIYHKKKAKLETATERKYFAEAKNKIEEGIFVEYACKVLTIELKKK